MRTIALEEHVLPADIARAAGIDPRAMLGTAGQLDDMGEGRIGAMDAGGIDVQVLSGVAHAIQQLDPVDSAGLSRELNDRMADLCRRHPDRFRAFATLPMSDPSLAAGEVERSVGELGFVGAMVQGQTRGVFLDDPSCEPVLAAAEHVGVPIYLHPGAPPEAVRDAYVSGLEPEAAAMLATAGWVWHAECGMHVLRMALSGAFERHPDLQVVVGHMGENLPFSLARADEWLTPRAPRLSRTLGDTIRSQVHLTTCGYTTVPPLLCALEVFGADRILFSVDYPFSDNAEATAFLREAPIAADVRAKIAHGNAERLLGFEPAADPEDASPAPEGR